MKYPNLLSLQMSKSSWIYSRMFFPPYWHLYRSCGIPSLSSQIWPCLNQNPAAKTKLESAQKYLTPNLLNLSYINLPRFLQHCCNTAAVLTIYSTDSDIAVLMVRNTCLKQNTFRVYKEFPKVFYHTKDKPVDYSFKFLSSKDFVLSGIGLFLSTGADVEVTVKVKDNNDEDAEVSHGQVKSFEIPSLSRYILRVESLLGKNSGHLLMSISGKLDLCSR